jgi:hypothetical protein
MTALQPSLKEAMAAAIANARAGRRGAPPIANILELLGSKPATAKLRDEVLDDADVALKACAGVLGIPVEALESGGIDDLLAAMDGLRAVRHVNWDDGEDPEFTAAWKAADAALAKVRGERS